MPLPLLRPIVLLVEDSDDDAFFFQRALRLTKLDSVLFHVSDGRAALDYLQAAHDSPEDPERPWPDLVFLDLKLPSFSGFEILTWIREQKFAAPLEVEVLSGSEHKSDIDRAVSLGATLYAVKPVSSEHLASRMQAWRDRQAAPQAETETLRARN